MVIKGGSRGSGSQLAGHLLRADTNERVEVVELTGVAATTLPAALREMMAVASGTRCSKPLYHASLNTGPGERLTPAQKRHAIAVLERRLGLEGHPRAVVEHRKAGRDHLHVVWSRIDTATMRAVHDGFNYRAHEEVARQLEREFAHRHVPGVHVGRDTAEGRRPRPARTPATADLQQAARTGIDPATITAVVTCLWQAADSGPAFAAALHNAGYVLAQGDKRGFCLLDPAGGVHSLARRIERVRTKEITARLASIDLASLPTIDQARAQLRQRPAALAIPSRGPAPPAAPSQPAKGRAGIPVAPTPSPRPPAGRQRGRTHPGGMRVAAPTSEASQRASYAVKPAPIAAKPVASPAKPGLRPIGGETRYTPGVSLTPPAAASTRQGAAPTRGGVADAAGAVRGWLGGLFAGSGGRAGAGVRLGKPPAAVPIGSGGMTDRPAFISGGRSVPPRTPPSGRPTAARPFARLLGPALGVPQEVIAWAMEARKKLIAYSEATGEYVATELEHLGRIISGAYLDQGLTVTGRQRQTGGPSP